MDVRCDRCQTEYELDEDRLTEAGIAVKCTNCGNIFKVKRGTGVYEALRPKVREWHVRRRDGNTLTLRDLTDLQRAVVERRVSAEDSVALSGGAWHTLGSMPELSSFFDLVNAANRAPSAERAGSPSARPPPVTRAVASAPTSLSPVTNGVSPSPGSAPPRSLTPVWGDGPNSIGPTSTHAPEPAWAASAGSPADPELTELLEREDLEAVKSSRAGLWAVLIILSLGGAAGGYFAVARQPGSGLPLPFGLASPAKPPAPLPAVGAGSPPSPAPAAPAPAIAAVPVPAPAPAPAPLPSSAPIPAPEAQRAPAEKPPAAPEKAAPEKAAEEAARVAKVAGKVAGKEKPAEEGAVPAGRSFDFYIAQGHRLLDSKPTQALALFEKAAALDPSSPEPDSGRGLAFANLERLQDAASAFQAALRKSSEFTEAIMGLAEISREQGNAKKAIGLYQRYLDLTPDGQDAPAARAQLDQLKAAQPSAPTPAPEQRAVVATPVAPSAPVSPAPQSPAPAPAEAPPPVMAPDPAPPAP